MKQAHQPLRTFAEWYQSGPFAAYVRERKQAGNAAIKLLAVIQPPGDLSDPPTSDVVLAVANHSRFRIHADYGAGKFSVLADGGTCFLRPPGARAQILVDHPNALRFFTFPAEPLSRLLDGFSPGVAQRFDFGGLHAAGFRNDLVQSACDRLWREGDRSDAFGRLYCDYLTLALFAELSRLTRRQDQTVRGGLAGWQMRRVCEAMTQSLDRNIPAPSLAGLAHLLDLSPNYFCQAFSQTAGMPPHRWLAQQRIAKAKRLLANPKNSIQEVALAIGFESHSAFGAAFKRAVGFTPSQYRGQL